MTSGKSLVPELERLVDPTLDSSLVHDFVGLVNSAATPHVLFLIQDIVIQDVEWIVRPITRSLIQYVEQIINLATNSRIQYVEWSINPAIKSPSHPIATIRWSGSGTSDS